MKKMLKAVPALAVVATLSLPSGVFASTDVNANYLVNADAKVNGTTVEINADLLGGSIVDSTLLSGGRWEIVDQDGKTVYVSNSSKVKLNAKIENLKPSVEYCFDIRAKGKINEKLVDADLKLTGDQKIALTEQGLSFKDGMLCVTTGEEDPKDPKDPKNPEGPKDPKDPKNPKEPEEPTNPKTPKDPEFGNETKPMEGPEEENNGGFLQRLLGSLF